MNIDVHQTVREVALTIPAATRVFERLGIDYCCSGGKSLEQACGAANLQVQKVVELLCLAEVSAEARQAPATSDWTTALLADLIHHIKYTHHSYTRDEITRLGPLFAKVCRAHGEKRSELNDIRSSFESLAQELTTHMMKEEFVLFPYIERLEEAWMAGERAIPAPFGSVENPVAMMQHDHETAGNLLRSMRSLSDDYNPPEQACASYKTLYAALAEFERDLHQHIHLENNILFPRAIAMEKRPQ
ncbi:MAG TPA: iron-sulfur cluster repair di-iron protein [Terriglobales bacterium]|nr:iron-sulfur cluster repair di-iron protein [Terriglobales bacterium]